MTDRPMDRFYGGPMDGHEQHMNPALSVQEDRVCPETGAVYRRVPSMDTKTHAGWQFVVEDKQDLPVRTVSVAAASKKEPLTLDELSELVAAARKTGLSGKSVVHAQVYFNGTGKRLSLQER